MRTSLLILLGASLAGSLAACAIGAPPGFSAGTTWTLPLVDPLADGRLVTPIYIGDQGPFLFAIDPDATQTTGDIQLAGIAQVTARGGIRLADEHDTTHPAFYAQIYNVRAGSLTVGRVQFALMPNHSFDMDGRRIWGVLGRDVIADSLVFSFDRDRGVARLTTQEAFTPPAGAQQLAYQRLTGLAGVRDLVDANVDGKHVDLHLDLGDVSSQLRPALWSEAKLASSPFHMELIDETGTHRTVASAGRAEQVSVGPVASAGLGFIPFEDGRWLSGRIDGTLGLHFFEPYNVAADWQHKVFYLTPRAASPATAADRLARWGDARMSRCAAPGCATAVATAAAGGGPDAQLGMADGAPGAPPPTSVISVHRDPAMDGVDLEIVLAATSVSGEALPPLYVDMFGAAGAIQAEVDPRYAGARFDVLDVSPFPRACQGAARACVRVAPPRAP